MNPGPVDLPEPTDAERADPALDDLMDRLRVLAHHDAPPPLVDALARAAFETRELDAELAVLTGDSDVDRLALVRSTGTVAPRMLSFETDTVGIEVQIDRAADGVEVRGLITGIDPGRGDAVLEVDTGTSRTRLAVDPHGWFHATGLPAGLLRVRLTDPTTGRTTTPWISTRLD
ncbi:hypothetical protein [Nakamurella deserti]|uniref:hypothetical protein n=1 Tax=Nakamurella deserti TaxID=2164074 RepID=UPI000DBE83EB|nr:hypothetical protein [Nakamurella deserti]